MDILRMQTMVPTTEHEPAVRGADPTSLQATPQIPSCDKGLDQDLQRPGSRWRTCALQRQEVTKGRPSNNSKAYIASVSLWQRPELSSAGSIHMPPGTLVAVRVHRKEPSKRKHRGRKCGSIPCKRRFVSPAARR